MGLFAVACPREPACQATNRPRNIQNYNGNLSKVKRGSNKEQLAQAPMWWSNVVGWGKNEFPYMKSCACPGAGVASPRRDRSIRAVGGAPRPHQKAQENTRKWARPNFHGRRSEILGRVEPRRMEKNEFPKTESYTYPGTGLAFPHRDLMPCRVFRQASPAKFIFRKAERDQPRPVCA